VLRGGAGTAQVGSHIEVADRIEEHAALGISEFILSGHPHWSEAYWFGEGVLPIVCQRGRWQHPALERGDAVSMTPFAPTSGPAHPAAVS
jgi:alkanesulfonate monooxygenase